jgi:catechol 2,3-dioxygenase-like lactoylglutathione lyase family enzyme
MTDSSIGRHGRLILVPAVITLAVTLLRLTGELLEWAPALFNRSAGGGGAIVGIVWLVPIFGIYFALRLAGAGDRPGKLLRAFGLVLLALVILPITGVATSAAKMDPFGKPTLLVFMAAAIVAFVVALRAWPELGRVLTAYGLVARVPVAIVMLVAILGRWGTHYDVPPSPDFPEMAPLALWFWIGLIPQLTIWVAFTVVVGMLFGLIAVAIVHRGRAPQMTVIVFLILTALPAGTARAGEPAFTEGAIHIGVVVKDLDASVAFYTDVIGMTKTGGFEVDAGMGQATGLTGGLPFSVTVLKLKDEPTAAQFKVMSFEKDANTPKSTHIQDALGMQYVTLMVSDLKPFVERIKARGVPLLGETPIPLGDGGNHFALVQDPDGTFIELIGPMK